MIILHLKIAEVSLITFFPLCISIPFITRLSYYLSSEERGNSYMYLVK